MNLFDFGKPEEFRIPIGYGHLAAKAWGPKTGRPILGLHGLRDNAGIYDTLVRYLPSTYRFIVMDFSCHGRSSSLPKGIHANKFIFLVDVCRMVKYLGWQRFSIIGHSIGAAIGLLFTCAYPEKVTHIICLDFLYPSNYIVEPLSCQLAIDSYLNQEDRAETFNEFTDKGTALNQILRGRLGLPKDAGIAILERFMEIDEYGSVVVRDESKLRNFHFVDFPDEDVFEELKNITAHCLCIKGDFSFMTITMPQHQAKTKEILMRNCKSFKEIEVLAMHFVHAEQPVKCSKLIKSFLLQ